MFPILSVSPDIPGHPDTPPSVAAHVPGRQFQAGGSQISRGLPRSIPCPVHCLECRYPRQPPQCGRKPQFIGYVLLFLNFRAEAIEFRLYQFRFGGVVKRIEDQNFPHRVFPQGQEQITVKLYPLKMFLHEETSFTVFLNGEVAMIRQKRLNVSSRSSIPKMALKSPRGIKE
jgi:hypothetical protein